MAKHALTIDPHEAVGITVLLASSFNQTGNAPVQLLASLSPNDLPIPNTGTYDMVIGSRAANFVLGGDFNSALKTWDASAATTLAERQR